MKKTRKKVGGLSKLKLTPEKVWLGNPLFMAALITIMAVLAFILADDWLALKKSADQSVKTVITATPTPAVRK